MRRLLRRRTAVAALVVVFVIGGGTVLHARSTGAAIPQYRTATATLGTVEQTLALSGNLTPTQVSDLDFTSSGRVTAVNVAAGDTVTAGEVLATIDPTALNNAVVQAQAALQSAQAKLSIDQAGPTAASLVQSEGQVSTSEQQLATDRISLQDTENGNTDTYDQAVGERTTDCASGASPSEVANCGPAVANEQSTYDKAVQSDDQAAAQVNSAEIQLQNSENALAAAKTGATPETIQEDQSQVTVAQDTLNADQTAVAGATLTAPSAGIVGEVNIAVGQTASSGAAGSTTTTATHNIVILTPGAFAVTGSVSDSQINEVVVGQLARVTPAGSSQALDAKVTAVSPEATVTSGVATFAVTATINDVDLSLRDGESASIEIVINQVVGVLTVPTSAVSNGTVQLMVNGIPQSRAVTTGSSDSQSIQIVSGLNAGDQVEIAKISSAIPTLNANSTRGGTRGGFGGAAGGAGGAARALGG